MYNTFTYRTTDPVHPHTEITPDSVLYKDMCFKIHDTQLSALRDELVTFWAVLWPVHRAPSADRPYNLWYEHTDSHSQQQHATLIPVCLGVTTHSGTNKHRRAHTYIHLGNEDLNLSAPMWHKVPMVKKDLKKRWQMHWNHLFVWNSHPPSLTFPPNIMVA